MALDTYAKKMNPFRSFGGGGVHGKVCWLIAYKDTRSTMLMERVDTDPYPSFKFYMKQQIFDSYQKECIIINCHVCRRLKINDS